MQEKTAIWYVALAILAMHVLLGMTLIGVGATMVHLAAPSASHPNGQEEFGAAMIFAGFGGVVATAGMASFGLATGCVYVLRRIKRGNRLGLVGAIHLIICTLVGVWLATLLWPLFVHS